MRISFLKKLIPLCFVVGMQPVTRIYLMLGVVILFSGCHKRQNTDSNFESAPNDSFYLFLLIGQSNMAGRGPIEAIDTIVHPNVMMLNQDYEWEPAREPLHFDKPERVGVGPGMAFGKVMAEAFPDVSIGLIPCAAGGSSIEQWHPGAFHDQTQSYPYDDMLKRIQFALNSGVLKGVLWHQGESDSKQESYRVYEQNLVNLIERLRQELNNPNLPFVAGELGDFYAEKNPYADSINAIFKTIPQKVKHTAFVEAEDLTDMGDETHFDSKSARMLGKRYASAMIKLLKMGK